jgi:RHS repeat-associated protein
MDGSCAHLVPNPVVGTEPKNADLAKRSCRCHTRYDSIYRLVDYKVGPLVAGTVPVTQTAYNLDAVGNWDSKTTDAVTENRTHNAANEITQIDTQAIIHDANGNLIQDANYDYTFDENNRLISVSSASSVVGTYAYDAMGRRISKTVGPAVTVFYYDNARIIETQETGGSGSVTTYTYGNYIDEVLTLTSSLLPLSPYFYHQNTLWSVHALTDATGAVVERYTYDAYGTITVLDPSYLPLITSPLAYFTFTGREYDAETDLYHYRARTYGPALGRFYSRDPLGYVDGMSLYQYVSGRATFYTDPSGAIVRDTPTGPVQITAANRLTPPPRMKLIALGNCDILFIYGHNYRNQFGTTGATSEGLQYIWNIVGPQDCSYAAVGGCWANLVPNEIPLPGYNYENYLADGNSGDGSSNWGELLNMWKAVRDDLGPKAAQKICSTTKCGCKNVVIKWRKEHSKLLDLVFKDRNAKELLIPCAPPNPPSGGGGGGGSGCQ